MLLFLGLPAAYESEGFDRSDMDLPAEQVELLEAVAAVNPRVVVVLANGAAVTVAPWRRLAPAIVEGWLGGQAGGSAVVDVLLGRVNPAGRLTETIPLRLEDNPSYGNFPGEQGVVRYGEGLLVGYRWYDARGMEVAFPFGHGLSYTTFAYSDVATQVAGEGADATVRVTATVTNSGERAGAEVVQVYVGAESTQVHRPVRELKAFTKVHLAPGESVTVTFDLGARDLSYWHPILRRWVVESGTFRIGVGTSSRELTVVEVPVTGEQIVLPLDDLSTIGEALAHPVAGPRMREIMAASALRGDLGNMVADMPLAVMIDFGFAAFGRAELAALIAEANAG